uniref:AMPA glutamate receptor ion channel-like protein n=1 Tax=Adineta vaga TaxID=104782 RepID=B3G4Q8_ADIVA|nr:AMPA glutamate receptor ion channel-like protein [Adineta vaga]
MNIIADSNGQNRTEYIGFMPDLIASLQEKTGFIPDIYLAPPNQTYNQLILSVSQGLYDLMIADTTTTATRRSSVDFSNSIFDNSLRLVICKSFNPSIDLLSFLKPFSRNLWLLVLAACFYAGALIFLAERGNNEALRDRPFVSQLLMSIWYAFDNMFGYGVDFDVHTAAGRLVTAGLYILSMILVASYTANLASDLTISKTQNIISGLDDLKNGNIPPRRVGIAAGTAGEDFYLREVSGDVRNYVSLRDEQAMFDYLLSGTIDVALFDGGVAEYMTNTIHCSLTLVDEEYDKGAFGIVMKKNWIYTQDLDVAILSLRESEILDDLRQKWFQKNNCPSESLTSTAISVESTSGLFVVFAVITFLSFALMLWKKRKVIRQQCFLYFFKCTN